LRLTDGIYLSLEANLLYKYFGLSAMFMNLAAQLIELWKHRDDFSRATNDSFGFVKELSLFPMFAFGK